MSVKSQGILFLPEGGYPAVCQSLCYEAFMNNFLSLLPEHGDDKLLTHFTLDIHVTQDMAPNAKVLVYYIRDDFEVVATSVQFNIKSCFRNKVCVKLET